MQGRKATLEVEYYNGSAASGPIADDVESMTFTDNAADDSDSIDITLNASDDKWINAWMPCKGAVLKPRILGSDWEKQGEKSVVDCGLFVLDDLSYSDAPTTMQLSGVSKPSDTDFSEQKRDYVWKNTSIKRIGSTIAERYGLGYAYDADDYDIDASEQSDTDSSYLNELCQNYGLVLKIYAHRLWVYDREKYKEKPEAMTINRQMVKPGSFTYSTTLAGTYTGGVFTYTDTDKDCDISCSVGGGAHIKSVSRRASSVYDASIQLCAELNNANHNTIQVKLSMMGNFTISAASNFLLSGYGALDGKYFVDKVTHKVDRSGGFTTEVEASGILPAFHHWDVGGNIDLPNGGGATTNPADNAGSEAAGAVAGAEVQLDNAALYYTSVSENVCTRISGVYYFYDGSLVNGRYRITNSASRCGKLPVGQNVTGWVAAEDCTGLTGNVAEVTQQTTTTTTTTKKEKHYVTDHNINHSYWPSLYD